jgi:hypothetical protein
MRPKPGDGGQIGEDDREIQVAHENNDFQHSVDLL